jgi:hypothetical protein
MIAGCLLVWAFTLSADIIHPEQTITQDGDVFTLTDVVTFTGSDRTVQWFENVQWVHTFEFVPTNPDILSADLTLALEDDSGWDIWETARLSTEGELVTGWFEVDTRDYSFSVVTEQVSDGEFRVGLSGGIGDFYLNSSTLAIDYTASVPEPSSLSLILVGILSMAGISLRRKKR